MKPTTRKKHCWFTAMQFIEGEPTPVTVSGYRINDSRLHIYKEDGKGWHIVHVPTGLAARCNISTYSQAASITADILPLINWEFDTTEEFVAQDNRPIKDYFNLPYVEADKKFARLERMTSGDPYSDKYPAHSLTEFVVDAEGYRDAFSMLEYLHTKAVVPCICSYCYYYEDREPDTQDDECPACERSSTVTSVLVLEGLI